MSKIPGPTNIEMIDSVASPTFPVDIFLAIQKEHMGHAIKPEQICKSKSIMFGIPHESVLAYTANIKEKACGVSYLWSRDLTHADKDFIFVEVENGLMKISINQAVSKAFYHEGPIFELEFGGAYVNPEHRGKGIFNQLFSSFSKTIGEIHKSEFKLMNDDKTVNKDDIFTTLTAKGPYSNHAKLAEIKNQMKTGDILSFETLSEIGIMCETIGEAREESKASKYIAEKKANMQLIGFSSNNLGPIYALPLIEFGK